MKINGKILKQQINTLLVMYYPHLKHQHNDPFTVIGENYNEAFKLISLPMMVNRDTLGGEFEMTRQAAINLSKYGNVFGIDNLEEREYV